MERYMQIRGGVLGTTVPTVLYVYQMYIYAA